MFLSSDGSFHDPFVELFRVDHAYVAILVEISSAVLLYAICVVSIKFIRFIKKDKGWVPWGFERGDF